MGKPGAVIIAFVVYKNLGLIFQPPECRAVDNPVPVPLVARPVKMFFFRVYAALRLLAPECLIHCFS